MTDTSIDRRDRTALFFWAGVALWLGVMVINWPMALSFGDEVGYVGQTKLILQGRIAPVLADPGVWHPSPRGLIPKYPLLLAFVLAPFFAISPALVFLPAMLAAIGLAWVAGLILQSWGRSRLWGLLALMDPTVVLLSRTAMADIALGALALATWYYVRRRAFWRVVLLAAATMAIKTTGVVSIGMILLGESYSGWRGARALPLRQALRPVTPLALGMILGGVVVVGSNLIANGTIHSSYRETGAQAFQLGFLRTSGLAHAKAFLLCPPLLIIGAWPFWQRRNHGGGGFSALGVIAATAVMMSVYFFVDWGVGPIDTIVLSRRLMMPVIVFLLVGYADLLARLASKLSLTRSAPLALIFLPAFVALAIGLKHLQWQRPRAHALARAQAWTHSKDSHELGVTTWAQKIGLLYPGRTTFVFKGGPRPEITLCGTSDASYRNAAGSKHACALEGYRAVESLPDDGYDILERVPDSAPGPAATGGRESAPAPSPTER
jgi:hypothetical protein